MDKFNSSIVIASLKQTVNILESNNIEYRFLGSVVIAAINGKLHRNLGDLDLIVDSRGQDVLNKELANFGYKKARGMFNFARRFLSLETLDSPDYLQVGYFHGHFRQDGSFVMGNKNIKLHIDDYAVGRTNYELYNIKFLGIPPRAAATGIVSSESNPKRRKEKLILKEKRIKPFPNNYIHIRIFGRNTDWIYHFSMFILNTIGTIRVRLGLAFDPWR